MLWDQFLRAPGTGHPLRIDIENGRIDGHDAERYNARWEGGMPLILPQKAIAATVGRVHNDAGTHFDYLEHYQEDAKQFDYFAGYDSPVTRDEIRRLHQAILAAIPRGAGTVLDAGCGSAWLAKALVSDAQAVISMDITPVNPGKAIQQLPHPNHLGLVADVFHLPLANDCLDAIVAAEIIEHVPDPVAFVQHLLRPLKPGGKLIITTPYNEKIVYYLCVHCNRPTPVNAHLHSFNEQNIKDLVPAGQLWYHRTFFNKYAAKLRLFLLLKWLPFSLWRLIDKAINRVVKSPTRLLIVIEKRA